MLPKRICVECGEIHALLKCPKCGCRQYEPITDAMTLALLAKNDRIAELEAALKKTIWQINYVAGHGYVGGMKRSQAEDSALSTAKTAARLLDGDK